VDDLREAVKDKFYRALVYCDAVDLVVLTTEVGEKLARPILLSTTLANPLTLPILPPRGRGHVSRNKAESIHVKTSTATAALL
jgi:hypothetical protein